MTAQRVRRRVRTVRRSLNAAWQRPPRRLDRLARDVDVVVAHPDDEALWLCPAVERARTVVVCYPNHARNATITHGWERARQRYPYDSPEYLPLNSAGIYDRIGDGAPPSPWGVDLAEASERNRRYVDNFARLVPLLRSTLSGVDIYTHNPWGEYGHYEHVQVCRAVVAAAREAGTSVWCWAGAFSWEDESRSAVPPPNHLRDHYRARVEALPRKMMNVDAQAFRAMKRAYTSTGSWTGPDAYVPPASVAMLQIVDRGILLLDLD